MIFAFWFSEIFRAASFLGLYYPLSSVSHFPSKQTHKWRAFLKVWNMTDSINWRSVWLDKEIFSHTRFNNWWKDSTRKVKFQNMDRLQLKTNARGPQFHIIKAHQDIEASKFNFIKANTCSKCVFFYFRCDRTKKYQPTLSECRTSI